MKRISSKIHLLSVLLLGVVMVYLIARTGPSLQNAEAEFQTDQQTPENESSRTTPLKAATASAAEQANVAHHYFAKTEHQHAATWSYEGETGPECWGSLDASYRLASSGKRQSPINIDTKQATDRKLPGLKFDYRQEQLAAFNNGHTIQHDEAPGSFLYVGNDCYALEQFHVHTPSEHTMNGKQLPMEIHFVHKADSGEVAVVAVLVEAGEKEHVDIPYYYDLPSHEGEDVRYEGQRNPSELLPPSREYYEYSGSFTTPPCTEDVRWIVMMQPVKAEPQLIRRFATILGQNNRPLQPLNGRQVQSSMNPNTTPGKKVKKKTRPKKTADAGVTQRQRQTRSGQMRKRKHMSAQGKRTQARRDAR